MLASASRDGDVLVWRLQSLWVRAQPPSAAGGAHCGALAQPPQATFVRRLHTHDSDTTCLAWSPDGTELLTGGPGGRVWNTKVGGLHATAFCGAMRDGRSPQTWRVAVEFSARSAVTAAAWLPQGDSFVTASLPCKMLGLWVRCPPPRGAGPGSSLS